MHTTSQNLRKAAVLIRSLDSETSAMLLAQLSPQEARAIRQSLHALGEVDPDEAADVVAEFRRLKPIIAKHAAKGVELQLTSPQLPDRPSIVPSTTPESAGRRFEFLERAPIEALVPYLSREHVQTIAVVLSHLPASRAAAVLAALPDKTQAETLERLSGLGETDPESLVVLERELAAWLAKRSGGQRERQSPNDKVASILAAADASSCAAIIANVKAHKAELVDRLRLKDWKTKSATPHKRLDGKATYLSKAAQATSRQLDLLKLRIHGQSSQCQPPKPAQAPSFAFEKLIELDDAALAAILANVDGKVLLLALAGSSQALIDRILGQMPRRMGRAIESQLHRLGPTRLTDVEAAQEVVGRIAAQQIKRPYAKAIGSSL